MLEIIKKRRSSRIIDPDRQVEEEKIKELLEAARWAPSCFNNQPWRFIVSREDSLDQVKECLTQGNSWAKRAPLIITVTSQPELDCQIQDREYYTLGIGLAVENLLLQGIDLGLVVHPIAGFKEKKVKQVLKIPDPFRVYTLIIIGYPGVPEGLDEEIIKKEKAPRQRKSLKEIAFGEFWGSPLGLGG